MRRGATLLLVSGVAMALATASGCQSPLGRYFANRARDLGWFGVDIAGDDRAWQPPG